MILTYCICTYFIWAYIHEYAHLAVAKYLIGVRSYRMKLFPHKHPRLGFVFASVSYTYERQPTSYEQALISFAPRFPDLVGLIVLPCVIYSDIAWVILCCGAVFDAIRGSFSFNRYTADIVRYTHGFGWNYRVVQSIQIILVLLSLTLCSLRYVANN